MFFFWEGSLFREGGLAIQFKFNIFTLSFSSISFQLIFFCLSLFCFYEPLFIISPTSVPFIRFSFVLYLLFDLESKYEVMYYFSFNVKFGSDKSFPIKWVDYAMLWSSIL